jgi:glucosamine--fructose-6-phosphate aminotransferase (isomerizing)
MLGERFESEIRQQPEVWCRLARSDPAAAIVRAIRGRSVALVGSGSSLFVAQLGALALRRRGVGARAIAATEVPQDHAAYRDAVVIACSQSGESEDLLRALDLLEPATLIAVTNNADSALGRRASLTVDVGAGAEVAVPASKSVGATAAVLLWTAAALDLPCDRCAAELVTTAAHVAEWLAKPGIDGVHAAAREIALQQGVVVVGTGFGLAVALECALKLKEASYMHAEGFAAGEFRHGSAAILDSSYAMIAIGGDSAREALEPPIRAAAQAGSRCYVIGARLGDVPLLGPRAHGEFEPLAWFVVAQTIALAVGRARNVDSDAPRGLSKIVLNRT